MGKRKIEMIEKESARQVCFSKRRQGLFKKAKELSTLCGVDITILVFSPAGRFYSFANTDIESILARYCKENNCKSPTSTTTTTTTTSSSNAEGGDNFWWEKVNVKEMEKESDLQQQLQNSLQEVRGEVVSRIEEPISSASSLSSLVTLPSSLDLTASAAAAAADVVTWPSPLDHLLPPCSVGDESAANAMNTTNVELEAPPLPQPHDGDGVMQVEEESLFLDFALDEDDDGLLMPVFGEEYDDGLLMKPVFEEDGLISGPMEDDMFAPLNDYGNLFGSFES